MSAVLTTHKRKGGGYPPREMAAEHWGNHFKAIWLLEQHIKEICNFDDSFRGERVSYNSH